MFKAVIPETVKLREDPSHGISILNTIPTEYEQKRIGN
jgi:hypothetical protein